MTSELLAVFDYYEREKGIPRSKMVDALSSAILTAARKNIGPARELRIDIDPAKGTIKAIAKLLVVETVTQPYEEISLPVAQKIAKKAKLTKEVAIGDEIDVEVTPKDMGRIAAQTARQAMMQRIRQEEKSLIYEEFKDRAGDIVHGTVRRFEKSDVIIDLGKFEGVMTKKERVTTEDYNIGDRLRLYVVAVENGARGPEIILSRAHTNFVKRLFESEVSEISDRTVEIRSISREAGYRTKIAVYSADSKVDPVGACVGMRGARVKNIVRELNNEKVDIIKWSDNPKEFLKDALKPAQINDDKITVDPANRRIFVRVREEDLSKAIGRHGQNVRLTKALMGWDLQVERDESAHEKFEGKVHNAVADLAEKLRIETDMAEVLVRNGLHSLEVISTAGADDIAGILEIPLEQAAAILAKAGSPQPA
ncbi:MAG TPA: transcription termination factor NusA [Verrucomicrobiales bacterium]|jgi:N utilization substance protein A|nr:transcription termination factor NusA [Verrucomicrobiales bacterium]